jgi:hypothetical protein
MVTLDETSTGLSSEDQAPFFSVSLAKFAAMSVCTFGIYKLYRFYKNWRLVNEREKLGILLFWRAFCFLLLLPNVFLEFARRRPLWASIIHFPLGL